MDEFKQYSPDVTPHDDSEPNPREGKNFDQKIDHEQAYIGHKSEWFQESPLEPYSTRAGRENLIAEMEAQDKK